MLATVAVDAMELEMSTERLADDEILWTGRYKAMTALNACAAVQASLDVVEERLWLKPAKVLTSRIVSRPISVKTLTGS